MTSIIIHAENKKDISLLKELSQKMGLSSRVLNLDEKEDLNLAQAIKQNNEAENLTLKEALAYYEVLKKD